MNRMFRRPGVKPTTVNDVVSEGHHDWDGRVRRAIDNDTVWKRLAFSLVGVAALSVGGNIYQAEDRPPPTVVHVLHDSVGAVIAISTTNGGAEMPSQAEFKWAIQNWVTNCRTVYVDINAMRSALLNCANMIEKGSQAEKDMVRFYNTPHKEQPFFRAKTETVKLTSVVAVPPTADNIGPNHMQTWFVTWTETVTSRDGASQTALPWSANVTFTWKKPDTTDEVNADPDGMHISSYTWSEAK